MRSTSRLAAFCTALAGLAVAIPSYAQQPPRILPSAMEQIRLVLEEKEQRTPAQRKLDSSFVMEMKRRRGDPMMARLSNLDISLEMRPDDSVHVDVTGEITRALEDAIRRLGGTVEGSYPEWGALRAWVPLMALEALGARPEVRWVERAARMRRNVTTEGDRAHLAASARSVTAASGAGVKVCVISDGVASLQTLQGLGELPTVDVLPGQAGFGTEGTAMLEIINDLAPGAALGFATAGPAPAQFATNIAALRVRGCSVIVDDIGFTNEFAFQDDTIARAVNRATEAGIVYVSAAGNDGRQSAGNSSVWEANFSPVAVPVSGGGTAILNNFGGNQLFNRIVRDGSLYVLSWSDPLQGSSNDYDLLLLSADGASMVAASTSLQTGTQRPFEFIDSSARDDTNRQLLIARKRGADRMLRLQSFGQTGIGTLSVQTQGAVFGHPAAVGSIAVGAARAGSDPNAPFPTGTIELFSSDGPRRIFYREDGTPITPGTLVAPGGTLRRKPDVIGADGVSTASPPPFNRFFGTSAAAPHVAGIAALVLSAAPSPTTRQRVVASMNEILVASGDRVPAAASLSAGDPKVVANALTASLAASSGLPCGDQLDNDGDGRVDGGDPGCMNLVSTKENPQCNDGVDNDMDGVVDLADQADCEAPFDDTECGSGAGQSLAMLPLLAWLARRKRKGRATEAETR